MSQVVQTPQAPDPSARLAAMLQAAFVHHQNGELDQAGVLYREIIDTNPAHADALHMLGVLLAQTGQYAAGVELITRAIAVNPRQPVYFSNRGNAQRALNQLSAALADYDQAIRLHPAYLDAIFNRGITHRESGQWDKALADFDLGIRLKPGNADAFNNRGMVFTELRRFDNALADFDEAIRLNPDFADAFYNRGIVRNELGRFNEALTDFDQAILLKPGFAAAFNNRGLTHQQNNRPGEALADHDQAIVLQPDNAVNFYNRGNALKALKRLEESIASYDEAIRLKPDHADAFNNRGVALQGLNRLQAALASYDQAILLAPANASAFNNRGSVLEQLDRLEESLASYQQAIRLMPAHAEAFNNQGNVLRALNRLDEAIASFDEAGRLRPGYHHANWNKSLALMSKGDFVHGWPLYESRWQLEPVALEIGEYLPTTRPSWQGQPVERLLLWGEQGVGDQVFFAAMFAEARALAAQLTVSIDARLLPLFERSFGGITFVAKQQTPTPDNYDAHLPIGSLGGLFRCSNQDFARVVSPYLYADRQRRDRLRADLLSGEGPLIGLSWGSVSSRNGAQRSVDLKALTQALMRANPQAQLVNLQYGNVDREIEAVEADTGIRVLRCPQVDNKGDLDGLAALISACDAVVSIQNTTLHMAGALGVPAYGLLIHVPDWRWQLNRPDSQWYPNVRLLRQQVAGDWNNVLNELGVMKL